MDDILNYTFCSMKEEGIPIRKSPEDALWDENNQLKADLQKLKAQNKQLMDDNKQLDNLKTHINDFSKEQMMWESESKYVEVERLKAEKQDFIAGADKIINRDCVDRHEEFEEILLKKREKIVPLAPEAMNERMVPHKNRHTQKPQEFGPKMPSSNRKGFPIESPEINFPKVEEYHFPALPRAPSDSSNPSSNDHPLSVGSVFRGVHNKDKPINVGKSITPPNQEFCSSSSNSQKPVNIPPNRSVDALNQNAELKGIKPEDERPEDAGLITPERSKSQDTESIVNEGESAEKSDKNEKTPSQKEAAQDSEE